MNDWARSYSQCGEDIVLRRALKNISNGFYIDIGAFDPTLHSVTRIFYSDGWSGINIEPNPSLLERFHNERPRDINLGVAVSDHTAEMELNVIVDTGLSTLFDDIASIHENHGMILERTKVQARSLAEIWDEFVPKGTEVHFLKIDVEGAEEAVIKGADWSRHRPWIVVAEAVLPLSTTPSHHRWDSLLQDAGYVFVNFDGLNRYYVDKSKPELIEPLQAPINIATDKFVPFSTHSALDELAQAKEFNEQLLFQIGEAQEEATLSQEEITLLRDVIRRLPRPLWQVLVFHRSGKPRKLFRRLFFHSSGKPRGIFRTWILRENGQPRAIFHAWMSSPAYQTMRGAIPLNGQKFSTISPSENLVYPKILSDRTQEIKSLLLNEIRKGAKK